jgi:hypothetical protein
MILPVGLTHHTLRTTTGPVDQQFRGNKIIPTVIGGVGGASALTMRLVARAFGQAEPGVPLAHRMPARRQQPE